ncbi:MAG: flavodoxin-dependent (E)-4-hydroxy-3-methylbut-2-enyl-diphosphate synthase [Christensenellaceae bacterium]|jgi:(E)-4-hydroxy-3-methylbut-2-enyl-diphosphate synthase|nr:flavodoxin-dependent (E)-4-hydroxy-3-methylbut-2-enyl-diphosphate synthase [Christensenellaceae bacterium]
MTRRETRAVTVGGLRLGGEAPILVQSMTNTDTRDAEATLAQIRELAARGAALVRVSVYDQSCAEALRALVDQSPVPLVADIHFDPELAIASIENGVHKLRLNPGNIEKKADIERVVACAKTHGVPIRIGVNSGSLPRDLVERFGLTPAAMVKAALRHVAILERLGFFDIVLSLKASDVPLTVESCRALAKLSPYPQHLGVTEAGIQGMGNVKSAIGIGSLLLDGIGDTLRVSLSGSPLPEPKAGLDILRALGLLRDRLNVVSCPSCGRCTLDVAKIAGRIEAETQGENLPFTVAVMGCAVNGPGEARRADIGVAGGGANAVLFKNGRFVRAVPEERLAEELLAEIRLLSAQNKG